MTQKKKIGMGLLVLVLILLCALGAGYLRYRRSPAYVLTMAAEAVEKHDWGTFQKYVDTQRVLGRFYQDAVQDTLGRSDFTPAMQQVGQQMAAAMKPHVLDRLEDLVRSYVEQGQVNPETVPKEEGSLVNPVPYRMLGGLAVLTGKARTTVEGNRASVTASVHDDRLNKDFPIVIAMEKDEAGIWRAVAWENAAQVMAEWRQEEAAALAALNAPIEERLSALWETESLSGQAEPADALGLTQQLRFRLSGKVRSGKPVREIDGTVTCRTPDGAAVTAAFSQQGAGLAGETVTWEMARELSPFVQSDAAVARASASSLIWDVKITRVVFTDGESVALYTQLPEKK